MKLTAMPMKRVGGAGGGGGGVHRRFVPKGHGLELEG